MHREISNLPEIGVKDTPLSLIMRNPSVKKSTPAKNHSENPDEKAAKMQTILTDMKESKMQTILTDMEEPDRTEAE